MKKTRFALISMILMISLLFPQISFAAMTGTFSYSDNGDGTATITGYSGPEKDIEIPSTVDGLTVTIIGGYAFEDNQLTSVVIPNSVTTIGYSAFEYNQLTSIVIPDSVTTISSYAFSENNLRVVVIPNSVTTINSYAFRENNLGAVVIPDSVTTINSYAFSDNDLRTVVIPNSVTTISSYAFSDNELTSVVMLNNSTNIVDSSVFEYNQHNPAKLTICSFDPSTAKDHAEMHGYTFISTCSEIDIPNEPEEPSHVLNLLQSGFNKFINNVYYMLNQSEQLEVTELIPSSYSNIASIWN